MDTAFLVFVGLSIFCLGGFIGSVTASPREQEHEHRFDLAFHYQDYYHQRTYHHVVLSCDCGEVIDKELDPIMDRQ